MRKAPLVVLAAVVMAPWVLAHEGHAHKVMGTVSVIHENHLEVKGTDAKTSTFTLTDKTKIVKGKTVVKATDIKEGDRVVVTASEEKGADGKTMLVASEVRLGTGVAPSNNTKQLPTSVQTV